MGIKTLGGDSSIAQGWILESTTTQWDGTKILTYRGGLNKFDAAKKAIVAKFPTAKDIAEAKDTSTGVGEITVTGSNIDASGGGKTEDSDSVDDPSVTLQGQMVAIPLYQAPYFEFGTKLCIQDLRTIDTLIREEGTITSAMIAGYDPMVQQYAQWLFAGEKNFLKEAYMLSITLHLNNTGGGGAQTANSRTLPPGNVVKWSAIWNATKVPERLQPKQPEGSDYWLPLAPTVYMSSKEVTVTQTYQGAAKFPNYYPGGTWEPPSLDGTTGGKTKTGTNWNLSGGNWNVSADGSSSFDKGLTDGEGLTV